MQRVPEPLFDRGKLRTIVFDLDGTLYRQAPLRRAVLVRLLRAYVTRPLSGVHTFRVLGAYRLAQERLRETTPFGSGVDLAEEQLRLASDLTHADLAFVRASVARWMEHEPLALLASCVQPGLLEFLRACKTRGLRLGVLSDYPAEAKLAALGLDGLIEVAVTAQSPEVGVFKPHPRGLLLAAEKLASSPAECLYVGDRAEIDGRAAEAAGMACFIVTRRPSDARRPRPWVEVEGFAELHELVLGQAVSQPPRLPAQPSLHRR